ncbi:MAG: hypothetical protein LQ341_006213, partial [Variospora aurantia]
TQPHPHSPPPPPQPTRSIPSTRPTNRHFPTSLSPSHPTSKLNTTSTPSSRTT